MKILKSKVQTETVVKGSRFLAEAIPCQKQEEARAILKAQKEKYSDATHVVHAFVLGKAGEVMGMSDDGEPGGTAGRPVLDVLKGSGATDIMLTVTRWFGGTLLGTGGLVKAYGGAAKELLSQCQEIGALEEYVPKKNFVLNATTPFIKASSAPLRALPLTAFWKSTPTRSRQAVKFRKTNTPPSPRG